MPDKSILCNICGWSHGLLHVYSLVGGLLLMGWYFCSSYGVANSFSSFSPFSDSSIGDPVLSPMIGCEHLPLCLPGSGRVSQDIAILGSCQQALLAIQNSVWFWCLYMGWNLWMAFSSVSGPHIVSVFPFLNIWFPLLRRTTPSTL